MASPGHISYYTREELETRLNSGIWHVTNYNRAQNSCGVTIIQFSHCVRPRAYEIGKKCLLLPALGFKFAEMIKNFQNGDTMERYFDTLTGSYLGTTLSEAAAKANQSGMDCLAQQNFEEARRHFAIASQCDRGNENYRQNLEQTQQVIENNERVALAMQQQRAEAEAAAAAENRRKIEEEQRRQQNLARGRQHYENGWSAEGREEFECADSEFEQAHQFLSTAQQQSLNSEEVGQSVRIVSCKIEGNSNYNEGVRLMEEGERMREAGHFKQANINFVQAKEYFLEGGRLDRDNKDKFEDCAQECQRQIEYLERVKSDKETRNQALSSIRSAFGSAGAGAGPAAASSRDHLNGVNTNQNELADLDVTNSVVNVYNRLSLYSSWSMDFE